MNDVIPGAMYVDNVFDERVVCNGTIKNNNGDMLVQLEYVDLDCAVSIGYDTFRNADEIEIISQPE